MPYQTGGASDPVDLLQKLAAFLVANGWTQDRSATEGFGWTVSANLGGNYVNLRATLSEGTPWAFGLGTLHFGLHMYLGTGFDGAQPFNIQTGGPVSNTQPVGVGILLSPGPFSNYYFFCDSGGDNVVVVVEKTPGLYVHLSWGSSLRKAGSYTGGAYFFGSSSGYFTNDTTPGPNVPGFTFTSDCPGVNADQIGGGCGFVRADVDSFTGKWIGIWNSTGGSAQGFTGKQGNSSVKGNNLSMRPEFPVYAYDPVNYEFQFEQTSEMDGRANLLPILLWVMRDGTTTGFSLLGSIPNIFWHNAIGNGFSNAEEYTIGPDTYKLFPNFAVLKQ
jgi:hypothetical protein